MESFVADVHLGKLARLLRMMGFDTAYNNSFSNAQLITIAQTENRILLSRNTAFAKNHHFKSFILTDEDPINQLQQVISHFSLNGHFRPFSRCMVCNGLLIDVSEGEVSHRLQQYTINYFTEFWECDTCQRIYWKGSHYEKMQNLIRILGT